MAASLKDLLAINKPAGISSLQALRHLQQILKTSPIFADKLAAAKRKYDAECRTQRAKPPGIKRSEIRIGYGGPLDLLASGVLVTGIGDGTKRLRPFLECTRAYEAVALFGCATHTYNAAGKVVKRAAYGHITKAAVEEALKAFRGDILQRPPLYYELQSNKKRLYEYAWEGKEPPAEIQPRPVTCELLELVDFTTNHSWDFPNRGAPEKMKNVFAALEEQETRSEDKKHAREEVAGDVEPAGNVGPAGNVEPAANEGKALEREEPEVNPVEMLAGDSESNLEAASGASEKPRPPAITLRMTVCSGFHVGSLIHDLGKALGSAAHVVKLVRTQQGQFEIGKNVVEWADLTSEDTLKAWKEEQKMLE